MFAVAGVTSVGTCYAVGRRRPGTPAE